MAAEDMRSLRRDQGPRRPNQIFQLHPTCIVDLEAMRLSGCDQKSVWLTESECVVLAALLTTPGGGSQFGPCSIEKLIGHLHRSMYRYHKGTKKGIQDIIHGLRSKIDEVHGHGCTGRDVIRYIPRYGGSYLITPREDCKIQSPFKTEPFSGNGQGETGK